MLSLRGQQGLRPQGPGSSLVLPGWREAVGPRATRAGRGRRGRAPDHGASAYPCPSSRPLPGASPGAHAAAVRQRAGGQGAHPWERDLLLPGVHPSGSRIRLAQVPGGVCGVGGQARGTLSLGGPGLAPPCPPWAPSPAHSHVQRRARGHSAPSLAGMDRKLLPRNSQLRQRRPHFLWSQGPCGHGGM